MSYLAQVQHAMVVVYTEGQEVTEELCSEFRKPENPLKTKRQPLGLHWPAVLRRKTSRSGTMTEKIVSTPAL